MGIIANGTPHASSALDAEAAEAAAASATSESVESVYDIDRLERAVAALVGENARLRQECSAIRRQRDEKAERILVLEGQLLDANQKRQDVAKRIDELIAQMDALDAQLAATESGAEGVS